MLIEYILACLTVLFWAHFRGQMAFVGYFRYKGKLKETVSNNFPHPSLIKRPTEDQRALLFHYKLSLKVIIYNNKKRFLL